MSRAAHNARLVRALSYPAVRAAALNSHQSPRNEAKPTPRETIKSTTNFD